MEDKVELVETNNLTRKQNIILYFFIRHQNLRECSKGFGVFFMQQK